MTDPVTVPVPGEAPYDVVIGRGLVAYLPGLVAGADRVAVLHSAPLTERASTVAAALGGAAGHLVEVPDGEAAKTVAVAARCWDTLAELGFTRNDVVVGVGGGAVTDLAGWVAATWLRGVRLVQVPTTMLGMVDAAIGGKTGVNIGAGKNLVGAFHPPTGVLCDLDALTTLPDRDLRAGLAEVVKAGFIADPVILDLIEADPGAAGDPTHPVLAELVHRAVAVKADVVGTDLREAGWREILNYGHTLGHAIEKVQDFGWRHGDAVSVGLVYAAELGRLAGRCGDALAGRHRAVLQLLGLPCRYAGDWEPLHAAMALDKKARGARLRFVVLDGLAAPSILADPEPGLLREAFRAVEEAR